jgi:hypothetical protein
MGLDALSYLHSGSAPLAGWQQAQEAALHDAVKPSELVDFIILAPLKNLVAAASAHN